MATKRHQEGNIELIPPHLFQEFFVRAVEDENFRAELQCDGFGALERAGFKADIDPRVREALCKVFPSERLAASRCGTCGVCGLCSLCGEINAGSGSAFLWATFFLGSSTLAAPTTSDG